MVPSQMIEVKMFYKIPRNTNVNIDLVGRDGEIFESVRTLIYIDTFFRESDLIEEFENQNGDMCCVFIIEHNVNDECREDYDTDEEYEDEVVNEVMYVLKRDLIMETDLSTQKPVSLGTVSVTV